jgi:hypothetical protein
LRITLALLALLVTISPAIADPIASGTPPQYRGTWCDTTWQTIYRRCHGKKDEDRNIAFMITRDSVGWEDLVCEIKAVRKSSNGEHRVSLECRKIDDTIEDRVTRTVERWRLGTNGTRLQRLEPVE